MQFETGVVGVRVFIDMIDPLGVEGRGASLNPMYFIAFLQQKLGQIGAILTSDASDQSTFCHE
jgi:hypothetical protein